MNMMMMNIINSYKLCVDCISHLEQNIDISERMQSFLAERKTNWWRSRDS